jgi:phosphate transport system protein
MTRVAFHQELREIEEAVVQMATLTEDAIARAMQALTHHDTVLANEVVAGDATVNELQRSIRDRCISIMARQAPVARDLRELTTVQLVINELERMADHAVGIAKQTMRMSGHDELPLAGDLAELGKLVRQQVRYVIQAFVDVNVLAARDICSRDDEIDHLYRQLFTALVECMAQDGDAIPTDTSLLFAAHDLERIGDRATNIAEDIIFMVTGEIEELN